MQRNRILMDVNAGNNGRSIDADADDVNILVITWYKMRSSGIFEETTNFTVRSETCLQHAKIFTNTQLADLSAISNLLTKILSEAVDELFC